jgi:hypothetical protein
MDELLEYPYFRKLFEDFTGTTDRDEMLNIFDVKVKQNVLSWRNTVLDNYLSLVLSGRLKRFISLEINGIVIGNSMYQKEIIFVFKDLLDGKNLPISKGIDSRICEFLEYSNFLSGKILTCDCVFDTYEHLVIKRRLPRCYIFESDHFEPSEYTELVVVEESAILILLTDYCKTNNRSFMIYCNPKAKLLLKNINATFVDSRDPRVLFPLTSTKNARQSV